MLRLFSVLVLALATIDAVRITDGARIAAPDPAQKRSSGKRNDRSSDKSGKPSEKPRGSDKSGPRGKTRVKNRSMEAPKKDTGRDKKDSSKRDGEKKNRHRQIHGLTKLTRYIHEDDEKSLPWVRSKSRKMRVHVDGKTRLSHPFEHTCGGNADEFDENFGHDGPSNFISFSNAGQYPDSEKDCVMNWDKGQARVKTDAKFIKKGLYIDMSNNESAYKWCYEGGTLTSPDGNVIKFIGAKHIKPWPYKCARSVYQTELAQSWGSPPTEWWTYDKRKAVAAKCAQWASLSREVLLLPDPDKILAGDIKNAIYVEIDRPRAKKMCLASGVDKCVAFNKKNNTVCCCSDESCGVPCPRAPGPVARPPKKGPEPKKKPGRK